MLTLRKLWTVAAVGALAIATTSFGEGYYDYSHGGFPPYGGGFQQRPYGGGVGTVANGGGMGGGFNSGFNQGFGGGFNSYPGSFNNNFMLPGQNLFNPTFTPYLNNSPWMLNQYPSAYSPFQNQWNHPWTSMNTGYGNNLMSPYFGNQFLGSQYQPPYWNSSLTGVPSLYNNGIPGMGYNMNGLGTPSFYDYGLSNYQGLGLSNQYYGGNDFNYSDYGLGLGFGGGYTSPYDSCGFGCGDSGGWDVGFGGGLSAWWY